MPGDDLDEVVTEYAADQVTDGDLLFITEKIVAITQGRSYTLDEIRPRRLAHFLSKYVTKTSYGIGLGMPETMEMALRECGTPRILFAAAISAVTKAFGRRGDFYRIAGDKARAIDGPTDGTIPPYDRAVVLGPTRPAEVAARVRRCSAGTCRSRSSTSTTSAATSSARRSTRRGAVSSCASLPTTRWARASPPPRHHPGGVTPR
jgi:hypothetical protein